jgi:flagellar basal-body rod protein FlgC
MVSATSPKSLEFKRSKLELAYARHALVVAGKVGPCEHFMSSISTIALSGMTAAARRLDVSASNVANAESTGALPAANGTLPPGTPQAYAPLRLIQTESAGGGTQTTVSTTTPSSIAISDPQAPFANQNGEVAAPNVDISQEMVDQMIASYSFAANAAVMNADDGMTKTLIDTMA